MSLIKQPRNKRTTFPRVPGFSKPFIKDWERLNHSGRYDLGRLKEVILLLIANDAPLPAERKDHELKGDWLGYRECHVGGDFLLIYRADDTHVGFARAGTHSELFG
jgi:mRNA interferase YafQ